MKKIILVLMLVFSTILRAISEYEMIKNTNKYEFVKRRSIPKEMKIARLADRIEADALLEVASIGYILENDKKLNLLEGGEAVIIMPRIDYLEKYINDLAKKHDDVYVFIMDEDKLDGDYGDRSYETFIKKNLNEKMPKNVKVFRLKNESVTQVGEKNNFEFSNIMESKVFNNQIKLKYNKISKIRVFGN